MNWTRGEPPGKAAENWSRRDGIRAGAVSGPWRSGARSEAATPARAPDQRASQEASESRRPGPAALAWTGKALPPATGQPPRIRRSGSSGSLGMAAWIGFGLLVATGFVVAAVLLRPQTPAVTAGIPVRQAAEAVPGPDASAPAEIAAPLPVTELARAGPVRLRVGEDLPAERRDAIVAVLAAAGLTVQVETLPFHVATSRVGYYRAEDREAAGVLAALVQPVAAPAVGEVAVRDYAELLSDAEPGRLDLWVGD